eukprot:2902700-Amphidinium_carterae.3
MPSPAQRSTIKCPKQERFKSRGQAQFVPDLKTSSIPLPDRANTASQRHRANPTTQQDNANTASCAKVARIQRRNEISKQNESRKPLKQRRNHRSQRGSKEAMFWSFGLGSKLATAVNDGKTDQKCKYSKVLYVAGTYRSTGAGRSLRSYPGPSS